MTCEPKDFYSLYALIVVLFIVACILDSKKKPDTKVIFFTSLVSTIGLLTALFLYFNNQ